jgi:hypothetical protein
MTFEEWCKERGMSLDIAFKPVWDTARAKEQERIGELVRPLIEAARQTIDCLASSEASPTSHAQCVKEIKEALEKLAGEPWAHAFTSPKPKISVK